MRRIGRVDGNQPAIVAHLRKLGAKVAILSNLGCGIPDLLIGFNGSLALLELKDGSKPISGQKLTEQERKFFDDWIGFPVFVINSEAQAEQLIKNMGEI